MLSNVGETWGAPVAHLSEWVPHYRGCVLDAVDLDLIPPCGPLLRVVPSLFPNFCPTLQLAYQNKGPEAPKISLKNVGEILFRFL